MVFTRTAQQALICWYKTNRRELPWRNTRDPYRIMVSEIMLQQTQVDRVVPKYHEFLARFPTLEALADAPASEVIRAWAGLGYNRRALNLQRSARMVVEEYDSVMPDSVDELLKLPGVGPYTAGAVACFAFEQDTGFMDTNIRRVLHRVTAGPEIPDQQLTPRELAELAVDLVPPGSGYLWNQSLIELGALICQGRAVRCDSCPVANYCAARPTIQSALHRRNQQPSQSKQPVFESTSRYFRGRIVDLLRTAPFGLTATELAGAIDPDRPNNEWILSYIDGLLTDGLLVIAETGGSSAERRLSEDQSHPYDEDPLSVRYRLPD